MKIADRWILSHIDILSVDLGSSFVAHTYCKPYFCLLGIELFGSNVTTFPPSLFPPGGTSDASRDRNPSTCTHSPTSSSWEGERHARERQWGETRREERAEKFSLLYFIFQRNVAGSTFRLRIFCFLSRGFWVRFGLVRRQHRMQCPSRGRPYGGGKKVREGTDKMKRKKKGGGLFEGKNLSARRMVRSSISFQRGFFNTLKIFGLGFWPD